MKVALVGNQNSGKTTLFNCLTGMNAKIGNWPGVTIEKKTGLIKGTKHEITDLPGIYSLSPYSVEEEVSRKFIFEEKPDVIINIIDATSIERSLYLTTQLLELDCKVIIALNMADMLPKKGILVDITKLQKILGAKVYGISALKGTGIKEIIEEIDKDDNREKINIFDANIETWINQIELNLNNKQKHKRFIAIKLLEEDSRFKEYLDAKIDFEKLQNRYDMDMEEVIITERYEFIENIKRDSVITCKLKLKQTNSDKIDKIILNKWISFPIFITIMFLVYYFSVGVIGKHTVEWVTSNVDKLIQIIKGGLSNIGVSEGLNSLVTDGIIKGVGAVLGFIPQLAILFLCTALLETTGYMSRVALLLDRLFRKIGLSGKSLIPFIIGSGCSVPGIMGTRIIENEKERKTTTILTPFVPCSAKLPIIVLFSGYFFKDNSGMVSVSLYFLAILVIIGSALIIKKFIYNNVTNTYISELPEYKIPNIKYIIKDVGEKIISFIKRAGTTILICSIIVWFLLSFSVQFEYVKDIENSIMASIGKKISWVFYPILGINSWEATVSAAQGLVAKEQVISSMAVISGLANGAEDENQIFSGSVFNFFTRASAYAFMAFNLFSAPCFGAIGAMKKELGGTKQVLKAIGFQTLLAYTLSSFIYQLGHRIETGVLNIGNILILLLILAIITIALVNLKDKNEECKQCQYARKCNKI